MSYRNEKIVFESAFQDLRRAVVEVEHGRLKVELLARAPLDAGQIADLREKGSEIGPGEVRKRLKNDGKAWLAYQVALEQVKTGSEAIVRLESEQEQRRATLADLQLLPSPSEKDLRRLGQVKTAIDDNELRISDARLGLTMLHERCEAMREAALNEIATDGSRVAHQVGIELRQRRDQIYSAILSRIADLLAESFAVDRASVALSTTSWRKAAEAMVPSLPPAPAPSPVATPTGDLVSA